MARKGEVWTGVGATAGWLKKLKDAGLAKQNLPKEYEDVIEGMSDAEVATVLDLKGVAV